MSALFKSPLHGLCFASMVAAYLAATTYPFRVFINHAQWQGGSAVFGRPGILESRGWQPWLRKAIAANHLAVDLRVEPYGDEQVRSARIFTISRDATSRNLTIAVDGDALEIWLRRSAKSIDGLPPFVVPAVFTEPIPRTLSVAISPGLFAVDVDGERKLEKPLSDAPMAQWDATYPVALGNEITSRDSPWLGEITRAEVRAGATTIDLLSPSVLRVPPLLQRLTIIGSNYYDLMVNFMAFVLFGILTLPTLRRPTWLGVAWLWGPICAAAEAVQVFIPGRVTSLSDFVLNVLGALVGGVICIVIRKSAISDARAGTARLHPSEPTCEREG